jgi:hypothetical protein
MLLRAGARSGSGRCCRVRGGDRGVRGRCCRVRGRDRGVCGRCCRVRGRDRGVRGRCCRVRGRDRGVRGRRRAGRRGAGFYARVTWRSHVSGGRGDTQTVRSRSRSGVVRMMWLLLDSVAPPAGPLAPPISRKDVTVRCAESRPHAAPPGASCPRGHVWFAGCSRGSAKPAHENTSPRPHGAAWTRCSAAARVHARVRTSGQGEEVPRCPAPAKVPSAAASTEPSSPRPSLRPASPCPSCTGGTWPNRVGFVIAGEF